MVHASSHIWFYIRGLFSAALLFVAVRQVDLSALAQIPHAVDVAWLLLALVAILLANLLSGLRWSWLLRQAQVSGTRRDHVGLYFAGALINQGVPTVIGGDAYRALQVSAPGERRWAVFAVVMDRFLGLLGNNLMGAIGLIAAGGWLGVWSSRLGAALLLGTSLPFLAGHLLLSRQDFCAWLDRAGLRFGLPSLSLPARRVFILPNGLIQAMLALLIHVLTLLALASCLWAFDAHPPLPVLMVWLSVLSLLLVLPVSAAGWGLREATLASTLALWGIAPDACVLASISYGVITLLALLPGLPWLLRGKSFIHSGRPDEYPSQHHALD